MEHCCIKDRECLNDKASNLNISSWQSLKLCKICQITTGKKDVDQGNPKGMYPFFSCAQKLNWSDTYSFDTEAILIAGNGDVGNTKYYKGKFEAYQRLYVLHDFTQNTLYVYFYLCAYIKRELAKKKTGSTMPYIKKGDLENFIIHFPSTSEQCAIAHVLQTVQQAIQARRKELELERERKAALMQHLFTHGTRNEPTKQSEVGEIPESWKVLKLGEILTLRRGFDLPTSQRVVGNIPVISSSGISGTHNVAKVAGPGVVTGRYGTLGEVFFIETDFWPLNTTLFVSDFKGNDAKFIAYFLQRSNLQSFNDKTSVPGINRNHVHDLFVSLPELIEQQKITNILQACDAKIAALEKEIALHEELFRALLDELMTGRISTLLLVEELEKGTLTNGQRTPDGTGTTD